MNGTGDRTCLGWTGRLCAGLHSQGVAVTYYNLGVRRDTSLDIAQRWYAEVSHRLPPSCSPRVVFSFGTNDTTWENGQQRLEFASSVQYCRQILRDACDRYPVLMISPPPIADPFQNRRTQTLCQAFHDLCHDLGVPYLDIFTPLLGCAPWLTSVQSGDGAHPDASGYMELAQMVECWPTWNQWIQSS